MISRNGKKIEYIAQERMKSNYTNTEKINEIWRRLNEINEVLNYLLSKQ